MERLKIFIEHNLIIIHHINTNLIIIKLKPMKEFISLKHGTLLYYLSKLGFLKYKGWKNLYCLSNEQNIDLNETFRNLGYTRYIDNESEIRKKWKQTTKGKLSIKKHQNNDKAKIRMKRYRDKPETKLKQKLYDASDKMKLARKQYKKTYVKTTKSKISVANYERNKKQNNPIYKLICNANHHLWKTCNKISINKTKFQSRTKYLGCTKEFFKEYIEKQFKYNMTWDNYGSYWDIDHIIPKSTAKSIEDIKKLFHYSNLQPLLSGYNKFIKRNQILTIDEIMQQQDDFYKTQNPTYSNN